MLLALRRVDVAALCVVALVAGTARMGAAEHHEVRTGAFVVEHELDLPGSPETIYDAITGDISSWWDHSFSEKPARFYIDARPGGGFYEIFDASGDGVRHAEVILAQRGKMLRFEGPLGLSGNAIQMVMTYSFEAVGEDSTRLELRVHAAGEMQDRWAEAVDGVWHHFLFERLKPPYVESGEHLER